MGDHGGAPVWVVEVVAETFHVPVAPHLAPPAQQVAGAVLADDGPAGVDLVDQVKHRAGLQCKRLKKGAE